MEKRPLNFWQIWNMSFGFLGIQFGWGLQMANMSPIYEFLGAEAHQLPILWLAAPLTGLIVQPIVGHMSDRTWGPLGRRRPYFLVGAVLSSFALVLMPNSSALWMAAGSLWILDASINISMEPFRAFVADLLPEEQRTRGFAMQSLFIGLGGTLASVMPWLMTNVFGVTSTSTGEHSIPLSVRLSFYIGAAAFFAAVLWTIITTKEYPPDDAAAFAKMKAEKKGVLSGAREIFQAIWEMPQTMKQLAWVQIFTWLGLFCMWLYFSVAVARNVFGAPDETSPIYREGVEWAGICFGTYKATCFAFSFLLPWLARRLGRKGAHSLCLFCGAAGLLLVPLIHNKYLLLVSMLGLGVAWASILAMPYAILSGSIPAEKMGTYMGIFNFFIVIPQVIAAVGFGWIMLYVLNNNRMAAVAAGGVCMGVAALLMYRVRDVAAEQEAAAASAES